MFSGLTFAAIAPVVVDFLGVLKYPIVLLIGLGLTLIVGTWVASLFRKKHPTDDGGR